MQEIQSINDLSPLIKDLRKKANLSQEELASYAGLSRTAVYSIESGKESVQVDTLLKILGVLNVKLYVDHTLFREEAN